jgi:hypothetical protein
VQVNVHVSHFDTVKLNLETNKMALVSLQIISTSLLAMDLWRTKFNGLENPG